MSQAKNIASIFLNLLFAIGVIITIIGFIGTLQFSAYNFFLDEYPINNHEDNCAYLARPPRLPNEPDQNSDDSNTQAQQLKDCQQLIIKRRQSKKVQDITRSIGLLVSGVVLAIIFNPRKKTSSE